MPFFSTTIFFPFLAWLLSFSLLAVPISTGLAVVTILYLVVVKKTLLRVAARAHCLSPSFLSPRVVFHCQCVVRTPIIDALGGDVGSVFHNMNY